MKHWQVLKLMVVGFLSGIARDEVYQNKNGLVFKKEKMLPQ
jgi:hypothetical protein